jgi:hypothetical protein
MKSSIKHNKLRNTGILFELLVCRVTADIMENKKNAVAIKLMQEFFNPKKELGKELMLYRTFFNVNNLSEQKSFQLMNLVTEQRKTLNQRELDLQKYTLIREIKKNFDVKEFFSARIPSYKIYASIYKLFDGTNAGNKNNVMLIQELANSQFTLVEFLSGNPSSKQLKESSQLSNMVRAQEDSIRFLSYKILIERFNKKYNTLDSQQKKLLQEYIYNITNTSKLTDYLHAESSKLVKEIESHSRVVTNKVTRIKLAEVVTQLKKIKSTQFVKESQMTAMLIGYEILKELKNL